MYHHREKRLIKLTHYDETKKMALDNQSYRIPQVKPWWVQPKQASGTYLYSLLIAKTVYKLSDQVLIFILWLYLRCTLYLRKMNKYETRANLHRLCANLHRFHILIISCDHDGTINLHRSGIFETDTAKIGGSISYF